MMNEEAPKVSLLQSMIQVEEKEKPPSKTAQPMEGEGTMAKHLEEDGDNFSTITATTDSISPKLVCSISFANKNKFHHGRKFSRRYDLKVVLDTL